MWPECGPSLTVTPGMGLAQVAVAAIAAAPSKETNMDAILVLLVIMWLLGMVSSYTFGGFLHLLLVLAVAVVLIRVIQGRRPV